MERMKLDAETRQGLGKGPCKRLRKADIVPAVVCKAKKPSINIQVSRRDVTKAIHTQAGTNVIIDLNVKKGDEAEKKTVIIKQIQYDPVKGEMVHVDFNQISLTEVMKFSVPLVAKGDAVGAKQDGGVLQHVLWNLEIECLPTDIPKNIEVDVAELKIGDNKKIKDITPPKGVKILHDPEIIILSVEPPIKEEELVAPAPAEGAAEPEVIREKKLTEEEAAAEAKEAKEEKKEQKGGAS